MFVKNSLTHPDLKSSNQYVVGDFYTFDNIKYPLNRESQSCIDIHNHRDLEMLYIDTGRIFVTTNTSHFQMREGDIAIFNSYDTHSGYFLGSDPLVAYYYLRIDYNYFLNNSMNTINQTIYGMDNQLITFPNKIAFHHEKNKYLKDCFFEIYNSYVKHRGENSLKTETNLYSAVFSMLAALNSLNDSDSIISFNEKEIKFMKKLNAYMSKHYQEPITINDIALELSYSQSNLYRMFRQCFNESPSLYIKNFRVLKAATEYRYSDLSISEIASEVGFSDYCYFSKAFKSKIGISPREFFRKKTNNSNMEQQ